MELDAHSLSLAAAFIAAGFLIGRIYTVSGYRQLQTKNREQLELMQKDMEGRAKDVERQNIALERIATAVESLKGSDGRTGPQP